MPQERQLRIMSEEERARKMDQLMEQSAKKEEALMLKAMSDVAGQVSKAWKLAHPKEDEEALNLVSSFPLIRPSSRLTET